jgi:hypothetical protein
MHGTSTLLPRRSRFAALLLGACLVSSTAGVAPAGAALPPPVKAEAFKDLVWRPIGPANMGGRVSDLAVVEKRPETFYVGLGTGGVFKTTNLGTTWSAVFEKEAVASVGAVAVWQTNPNVVWVGTGEANSRNSSSWGNGVYRSLDAGVTWKHLGLEGTHTISRVVTDPGDSQTVYVAALGRLWGENPERGVYVTRDGGASWTLSLKVDARTGACDLVMDPSNPRVLYAAMHARRRTPWSFTSGGTTGGIFKSADGGRSWKKLTQGLPAETGRIGLDVYRKDPSVVLAVIESGEGGQIGTFDSRSRSGGVFRSDDGGEHWARLGPWSPRPFYFSQIRVQPDDDKRVYLLGVDLWVSDDAGRTFRAGGGKNLHPDFHAMWIDPSRGDHVLTGTDGGIFLSHDRTASWDFINNLAVGEFYNLAVDLREPYRVYGGLQDNQTWGGPSQTRFNSESWLDASRHDGITNGDWYCLGGGDGFHVAVDPTDPDIVYYESQTGWLQRVNLATGKISSPGARERPEYRFNDTVHYAPRSRCLDGREPSLPALRARRPMGGGESRSHDARSEEDGDGGLGGRGPLHHRDPGRVSAEQGPPLGRHRRRQDLADPGRGRPLERPDRQPARRPARSLHEPDRGLAPRPRHGVSRRGRSSQRRVPALPARDARLREDVDVDRGRPAAPRPGQGGARESREPRPAVRQDTHWIKAGEGMPTVAVDDILIHPRERDLIAGTHGRSILILDDITALEQWKPGVASAPVTLFAPRPATAFHYRTLSALWGQKMFTAKNPAFGAYFNYYVKEWTGDGVSMAVTDSAGTTVRKLTGPGTPGFHRVVWDLQREPNERLPRAEWGSQADFVPPGTYTVKLTYGKQPAQTQALVVRHAPGTADPAP